MFGFISDWIDKSCAKHYKHCEPFCCDFSRKDHTLYLLAGEEQSFLGAGLTTISMPEKEFDARKNSFSETTLVHVTDDAFTPYRLTGGLCPHAIERRCAIHSSKPKGCREFPLYFHDFGRLDVNTDCPIITPENLRKLDEQVSGWFHKLSSRLEDWIDKLESDRGAGKTVGCHCEAKEV